MTRTCVTAIALLALIGCDQGDACEPDAGALRDAAVPGDSGEIDDGAAPADAAAVDASLDAGLPDAGRSRFDEARALLESDADAASIDALIRAVAWEEGWPLREGTQWLFATRWDDAPSSVALVGDVNAWTRATRATRAASGVHYWIVIDEVDFVVAPEGAKYKWWGAPDVFRAPPESTAYGFDEFGEFGWVRPPVDAPHLERFPMHSSAHLELPRTVRAWLPAGFVARSPDAARARTLLLHDGQNVFHPDAAYGGWQVDRTLERDGWDDVVAIAIDNAADRMDAYTHVADRLGGSSVGGRADDYLALIDDEVLPFARARYGIAASGESLMIAGSSLGGLVSIWIASQRPALASCVAGLSSTLGWGSIGVSGGATTLIRAWSGHPAVSIYLDSGGGVGAGGCVDSDGDGVRDDGDDADNFCVTQQMRDVLIAAGYDEAVDLRYAFASGAGHDEGAWRARFPMALAACASAGWRAPE